MEEKQLREYVRSVLKEKAHVTSAEKALLQKIDDGPYHMLPMDELDDEEFDMVDYLVRAGLVKFLKADRRFPERVVLSGAGSHATDTFAMDTLRDEKPRRAPKLNAAGIKPMVKL